MRKQTIMEALNNRKDHSAWDKAVTEYAIEILDRIDDDEISDNFEDRKNDLLNGAENWHEYSWGGCSLIYDYDIAERTCNPSELKRTKGGELNPNSREQWLDVQARALNQAFSRINTICRANKVHTYTHEIVTFEKVLETV